MTITDMRPRRLVGWMRTAGPPVGTRFGGGILV
jgi:hypothetical protein